MVGFNPEELARWCGGQWLAGVPAEIRGVVHDTAKVTRGALFVAIRGARFDGHGFVAQALGAGAAAALVSRTHAARLAELGFPLLVVEDTAGALKALATGYRIKLGLPVIGVSGSTGKTTVKEMIACLLEERFTTARTMGNWNNEIGLPLSILAIPAATRMAVLELGISHPGEMAPLCAIARPEWGVITNVGPVHLEFFPTVEAIAREKGELFRSLPATGTAVFSADEPHAAILRACAPGRVITTSMNSGGAADYRLVSSDARSGLCRVEDGVEGGGHEFQLPIPGAHNRCNALLAIAVARGFGVSWDQIATAFGKFVAPPMRWEQSEAGGVTLINDAYNANPVSMRAALRTFAEMQVRGRKWLVLGDMLELGPTGAAEHLALGRSLAGGDWAGVITVGQLGAQIAEGALAAGWPAGSVQRGGDWTAAVEMLRKCIAPGDAILVKASRGKQLDKVVLQISAWLGKD